MGHCLCYPNQPCQSSSEQTATRCCCECKLNENCVLAKCLNHPDKCGKFESEKAVKVYGKDKRR